MFSFTAVAASLVALALAVTLVVPRGDPGAGLAPGAASGAPQVVAVDGSADFTTIGEAVAAAVDGDTVLVKPGEYVEAVVIDKDIALQGDGPRDHIVVGFLEGAPPEDLDGTLVSFPLVLRGSDGTVSGLSLRAPNNGGALLVDGGMPLLQDLSTSMETGAYGSFAFGGTSRPTLRDVLIVGDVVTDSDGTSPTIERNTVTASMLSLDGPGEVTVRNNAFLDGGDISASNGLTGLIEGNAFTARDVPDLAATGISIDTNSDVVVRANSITGTNIGISVAAMGAALIQENELTDDDIGVAWNSTPPGTIDGDTIRGGSAGIVVSAGTPVVTDNSVDDQSFRGIAIGSNAGPSLSGNSVCGCTTNLWVDERAQPEMGDNEICSDEPAG